MSGLAEVLLPHRSMTLHQLETAVLAWLADRLADEGLREAVAEVLYTEERDGQTSGQLSMPEWDDVDADGRIWWEHNADAALTAVREALTEGAR